MNTETPMPDDAIDRLCREAVTFLDGHTFSVCDDEERIETNETPVSEDRASVN